MARDPFETAADDAFREGAAPERELPPAPPQEWDANLGRDGELPTGAPRSSVPPSRRADASRPRTSGDRGGTGVPTPFDADPEGERFRDGGTFSNEPGWFEAGPKNAQLVYWMNLGGFIFAFLPIVAAAMAFINLRKVGPELSTHYTYGMRTLLLALLYGLALVVLTPPEAIGTVMLLLVGWYGWRNLRGLAKLGSGEAMPNPGSWTI